VSALPRPISIPATRAPRSGSPRNAAASKAPFDPRELRDDELLALVLGGGAATDAARELLRDGGLPGLAGMTRADLLSIGRGRTTRLLAALELGRRVAAAWPSPGWRIRSPADLAERLVPAMGHLEAEELRAVLLNTKNAVTGMVTVYAGNLAGSSVRIGEVFRDAVRRQAASLVVVHNHPSGDPSPSAEDLRITREMAEAGRLLDIDLLDHLVIGHGRWVSLRALGAL
jgi:DNA repair protein RadC